MYALGQRILRIGCIDDSNDGLQVGFMLNPSEYHQEATFGPTAGQLACI